MTLTCCEFHLFTAVTGEVVLVHAPHTDQICCTWLQVFTIHVIVSQSINYNWFERFRYLEWIKTYDIIKSPRLCLHLQDKWSQSWRRYLLCFPFFTISHDSFQAVSDTGTVIHVQTPGDCNMHIGFHHCDICWDSGLNCGRRREAREVSFSCSALILWDWDFQLTKRESTHSYRWRWWFWRPSLQLHSKPLHCDPPHRQESSG